MKRYSVKTFHNRLPFSSGHRLYNQIEEVFTDKNRRGGVIVFPVELQDFDNSVVEGMCSEGYYFLGEYKTPDGAFFGKTSICIDVRDMASGNLMTLAMKCSRIYHCTVLLKDIDDHRLFTIHYNGPLKESLRLAA